jgi:hypothetical protein
VYHLPRLFCLIVVFIVPLLSLAAKCAHLLHLGSDEWYLDEIKKEYSDPNEKGYEREDIGDYIHKVLRVYAEADFDYLGLHLPGAPDKVQPCTEVEDEYIPTRHLNKPDWLDLNPRVANTARSSCTIGSRTASIGIPRSIPIVPIG